MRISWTENSLTETDKCPICGCDQKVTVDGETVCSRCGYVYPESERQEYHKVGSHEIIYTDTTPLKYQYSRHILTGSQAFERTLFDLKTLSSKLSMPSHVEEEAIRLYRKIEDQCNFSKEEKFGACVFLASKIHGYPLTMKDVSRAFHLKKRRLYKAYKCINLKLSIKVPLANSDLLLERFATMLGLSEKTKRLALSILKEMKGLSGSPLSLVATSLYLASQQSNNPKTQYEIAEIFNITDVTIRNVIHRFEASKREKNVMNL